MQNTSKTALALCSMVLLFIYLFIFFFYFIFFLITFLKEIKDVISGFKQGLSIPIAMEFYTISRSQTITVYHNVVVRNMLRAFDQAVATCCDMLQNVGCCWLTFENGQISMQHLGMLHDVVVVLHVGATMLRPGMHTSSIFNTQHACRNTLQEGGQTGTTCFVQQCCDVLRSNVAIVRPELENAGPTMLEYVVLKCCDRFTGAYMYHCPDTKYI